MNIILPTSEVLTASRVGRDRIDRPRLIRAELRTREMRNTILRNKKKTHKDTAGLKGHFIDADRTIE